MGLINKDDVLKSISDFALKTKMCGELESTYQAICDCMKIVEEFPESVVGGVKAEKDVVNHPSHYCQEGSMECIDEMLLVFGVEKVMDFCLLNVWKYRKRAVFKNGQEDIKKSDWYMNKYKELIEGYIKEI